MPDDPKTIDLPPSAAGLQVATFLRDAGLIFAAVPLLVALLGKGDVIGLVNWLGSAPGIAFLGAAAAIVIPIWRQLLARRTHAELSNAKAVIDSASRGR